MNRGDVFDARLDPTEGSEQAATRPVIIVSRDAINASSGIVMAVPCTTYRPGRRIYPSQVLLRAPDGGLVGDSVALGEQLRAIAKSRLLQRRGQLSPGALVALNSALALALDLPTPP